MTEEFQIEDNVLVAYNGSGGNIAVPGNITVIGDNAFAECGDLVEVALPAGVVLIGRNAFKNCAALQRLKLPENLEAVEKNAFLGCSSLTLTLPEGLQRFNGKRNPLAGRKVKWIEGKYFISEDGETFLLAMAQTSPGEFKVPDTVKNIDVRAFPQDFHKNNPGLGMIVIPYGLKLEESLFEEIPTDVFIKNLDCPIEKNYFSDFRRLVAERPYKKDEFIRAIKIELTDLMWRIFDGMPWRTILYYFNNADNLRSEFTEQFPWVYEIDRQMEESFGDGIEDCKEMSALAREIEELDGGGYVTLKYVYKDRLELVDNNRYFSRFPPSYTRAFYRSVKASFYYLSGASEERSLQSPKEQGYSRFYDFIEILESYKELYTDDLLFVKVSAYF